MKAYIAAMPGWKRGLGTRLDAIIVRTVPGGRKAVRWNSPFYGIEGRGWFLSFHVCARYVKVACFSGTSLRPVPPGGTVRSKDVRWIDIYAKADLDEAQMAKWIVQAAALPGWVVIVAQHSGPLSASDIEDLTTINTDVRLGSPDSTVEQVVAVPAAATASPDDRLEAALAELRHTVRAELLETLADVAPTFFETIVLEVLHKMGYGTSRADLQQVGGPGDAGIDGIISLDRLGLEKVYVQAKKWQNVVGRPEVQAFYGALAGQRANKGVFITTSSFTSQAVDFARSVERVVLVDGAKLTDLMIEHEVGVTLRPVKVPKIDTDYFEE